MDEKQVLYLCDRKLCEECSPECKHTIRIEHALNFKESYGAYVEQEVKDNYIHIDIAESEELRKALAEHWSINKNESE